MQFIADFSSSQAFDVHERPPALGRRREFLDRRLRMEIAGVRTYGCHVLPSASVWAHRISLQSHDSFPQRTWKPQTRCGGSTTRRPLRIQRQQLRETLLHLPWPSLAEILCRTSSQETDFALPESKSAMRLPISWSQASSVPWSETSSKLSIRERTNAVRSCSGRERAFCSNSRACCVMGLFYIHSAPTATHPRLSRIQCLFQ